jgi:hypothetical protein
VHDLHHFDLVELMLADHAAHIPPAAARLGTEARRVGGKPYGQVGLGHDGVAHGAGQADFRRGDQVQVLARHGVSLVVQNRLVVAALGHPEHVVLELGQLARAEQGGAVDDIRRIALLIAVLAGLQIEHELSQCAVQPGNRPAQHHEARAGKLARRFEIQADGLAQGHVVFGLEGKGPGVALRIGRHAGRQPAPHFDVVVAGRAIGHAFVRQVGYGHEPGIEFALNFGQVVLQLFEAGRNGLRLGHLGRGVLALGFELADQLGNGIAASLQGFSFNLQSLATGFELAEPFGVELDVPARQRIHNGRNVFTQLIGV